MLLRRSYATSVRGCEEEGEGGEGGEEGEGRIRPGSSPPRQICATRPRTNPPTHSVSESSARQKWNAKLCRWAPRAAAGHSSSVHSAVFPLPGPPTSSTPQEPPADFADPAVRVPGLDAAVVVDAGAAGLPGAPVTPARPLVFSWRQCWILWKTHSRQ
ncbi:hypothetical protein EYF80_048693 [Liparis tanakae]|uniref:Uncharacterized protein n=1 Tax=Liparis tanakae TaxID=230148 RepID=A0A4Z2FJP2_9TELE|nr:hypothetical protein EYF80_048693 [Liparis tanakae]